MSKSMVKSGCILHYIWTSLWIQAIFIENQNLSIECIIFFFVIIPFCLFLGLHRGDCRPFIVDGEQVGVIRPDVLKQLFNYPEVFCIRDNENSKVVELNPAFRDYNEKSENVDKVLRQFRNDGVFVTLKGWRDEVCIAISI